MPSRTWGGARWSVRVEGMVYVPSAFLCMIANAVTKKAPLASRVETEKKRAANDTNPNLSGRSTKHFEI